MIKETKLQTWFCTAPPSGYDEKTILHHSSERKR